MPKLISIDVDLNFINGNTLQSPVYIFSQNTNVRIRFLVKNAKYQAMKIGKQYDTAQYLGSWWTNESYELYVKTGLNQNQLANDKLILGQDKSTALSLQSATYTVPLNTYFCFYLIHIFRHTNSWCEKRSWGRRTWHHDRSDTYENINKSLDFDILELAFS